MSHRKETSKRKRKSCRYKPYSMTNPSDAELEGFVATGRTGRRNALPDILDDNVTKTSTADLPEGLDKLSFSTEEKESESTKDDVTKDDITVTEKSKSKDDKSPQTSSDQKAKAKEKEKS